MLPDASNSTHAVESTSHLIVLEGRLAQTRLPLNQPIILLGSDPACDIWLPYPDVAPQHAILAQVPTGWFIRVIDATKTIALNGKTIASGMVSMGDRICLGHHILELEVASNRRKSETEAIAALRVHAAAVSALHAGAIEERWHLDQRQVAMERRARQIATRLKKRQHEKSPVVEAPAPTADPASLALLKDREEMLAMEQVRVSRLRKRLLKRWKTQFGSTREALARREKEIQRREIQLAAKTDALETRLNHRQLQVPANPNPAPVKSRYLTLREDLLADLDGLKQREARLRHAMPRDWPLPEQHHHTEQAEQAPNSEAISDDVLRLLAAAESLAGFQARWDADMESSLMSLEDQAIRMAQREHLIAERETLLETLLDQRARQSEELNRTINGAAREHLLSEIERTNATIEINRLKRELKDLTTLLEEQPPTHEPPHATTETMVAVQRQLETLIELLEKAGEWACEAPGASERAELEFLRFNTILDGNERPLVQDANGTSLRLLVQSACDQIQNSILTPLRELPEISRNNVPTIDRRLVMEVKRWRFRAEALEVSLAETQRLLALATGDAPPTHHVPSLRAA